MANRCQMCEGIPSVAVEDWRSVWLGMPDGFYLEWGRCCNDKKFEIPVILHNISGEEKSLNTPGELWGLIAGEDKKETWGEAIWF
jgi:hypothetical protein